MKDSDWMILHELYKHRSITKVANLLYITQPSLTKRLQHMEAEFQVTIVNRTPRGLEFTNEGEFLAEQAEVFLDFMKTTKEQLEEMKENAEGTITIGSSYTYSKFVLSDILFHYSRNHPNIHFNIVNDQSNMLFRKMLEGSVDVGFIRGDYEGAVNQLLIGRQEAYLVTKKPVKLNQLIAMQRIEYKTNDRTIELLDGWWQDWFHTSAPPGMMVGYIDFAWQLIYKGLGYTCCFLPDNFENQHGLCLTPLTRKDGSVITRNTWFIYSKNKRMTGILEDFIRYIESEVALK